jgi:hypothetical protein
MGKEGASLNEFEHAGWQLAIGLILLIAGAFVGRKTAPKNDCSKCGIEGLKAEIQRLRNLIETLWGQAGLKVKDRLEIEALEAK